MTRHVFENNRLANDPERIVPEVYRHRIAKGLDHLEAYRTAVETYRELRPDVDDREATEAVSRILEAAGIEPDGQAPKN